MPLPHPIFDASERRSGLNLLRVTSRLSHQYQSKILIYITRQGTTETGCYLHNLTLAIANEKMGRQIRLKARQVS